jgi:hypothetical protein
MTVEGLASDAQLSAKLSLAAPGGEALGNLERQRDAEQYEREKSQSR